MPIRWEATSTARSSWRARPRISLWSVTSTNGVKVPAGSYDDVLVTEEWTPLEPDVIELKYYAKGIGVVEERQIFGGTELVKLTKVTPAP